MSAGYHVKRSRGSPTGEPLVDQGIIHGLPVSWNPDDCRFYVHAAGTTDGTNVLGTFKSWRNATAFCKRKGPRVAPESAGYVCSDESSEVPI